MSRLGTLFMGMVLLLVLGVSLLGYAYSVATRDPVVRSLTIALPGFPAAQPGMRVVLVSDIHVGGPDMPPERLRRIVASINRLRPDMVLIAGDFVSDKLAASQAYPLGEAVAPLRQLRSRAGVYAVLGNHDHWRDAAQARTWLRRSGVRVLDNEAARAGPLVIGGLDDDFTGHADLPGTLASMRGLGGAKILLSHSPDPFPAVPSDVPLMVAGHTHCGQLRLPVVGALATMSRYGGRYACGVVREGSKTLVVGAGLGTSLLPLRLGAVPDIWLIQARGAAASTH